MDEWVEDELKLYLIAVKNLPYQISTEKTLKMFTISESSWWNSQNVYISKLSSKIPSTCLKFLSQSDIRDSQNIQDILMIFILICLIAIILNSIS